MTDCTAGLLVFREHQRPSVDGESHSLWSCNGRILGEGEGCEEYRHEYQEREAVWYSMMEMIVGQHAANQSKASFAESPVSFLLRQPALVFVIIASSSLDIEWSSVMTTQSAAGILDATAELMIPDREGGSVAICGRSALYLAGWRSDRDLWTVGLC